MGILVESAILDFLTLLTGIVIITIIYFKWSFSYWKRRNLPSLQPTIPFGNFKKTIFKQTSFLEQFEEFYNQIKARKLKHAGIYFFGKPVYVPIDPEIIKNILIKDFKYFVNRKFDVNEEVDPLSANLVMLQDDHWKNLRARLTPTFTSGRIKAMVDIMVECTLGLGPIMDEAANQQTDIDIFDILGRFTTDIIGSCAFGINCNSLSDPNNIFFEKGKKIFQISFIDAMKFLAAIMIPRKILKPFKFKQVKPDSEEFYRKIVKETVEYREKNNITRNDFMQLLIQLKNEGIIDGSGHTHEKPLNMDQITAQAFVFFVAGFETSSNAMGSALYELAKNQELQKRARKEIKNVLQKSNGIMTYEAIASMEYLERVLNETMRLHLAGVLMRVCNDDYTIPNTSVRLEKDTFVVMSIRGLCRDPEYYPNPEIFDPERFTEENQSKRPPCTWLQFGDGPRTCIGKRFAITLTKIGLATLLKDYSFTVSNRTVEPLQLEPASILLKVKGGIWLNVTKI